MNSNIDINNWIKDRIKQDEVDKFLKNGKDFINEQKIQNILKSATIPDKSRVMDILDKSMAIETLSAEETGYLLKVKDKDLLALMRETGAKIKKKVYDNRVVTFAPLYMGNFCVNDCLYCGFRSANKTKRDVLSTQKIKKEIEILAGEEGHKRLIVVYGEHPTTDVNYIKKTLKTIYSVKVKTKKGFGGIRRANVNAAPMSINELKILNNAGIGTYQVFQETYHKETYSRIHPKGTIKSDYYWRLYTMHRAFEAGIDDVGIGALFGLYDWKYEVLALVLHSNELENRYEIGPHTISFPRLEPAFNAPWSIKSKFRVKDEDFLRLITILRLAVPHTGLIVTCRETPQIKKEAILLGCTQTDASTKIGVGSYAQHRKIQNIKDQQFTLGDTRSLQQMIEEFIEMGFITSFCTAGYRCGRTGKCILDLLRSGEEGKFCKLNAILTFREWLDDFASTTVKKKGEKLLEKEIYEIKKKMPKVYPKLIEQYNRIKNGERDIYF